MSEVAARQAWLGIICKISHLLTPLRADPPIIGTAEEREARVKHIIICKRSLISFCLAEAASLISAQKYDLAVPAATQALQLTKDLDGELSVAVVEPMLQLSQAHLGLNLLRQAEEYLALARWNVLNAAAEASPCSDCVLARLHMLQGRVLTAQGNFNAAKDELAQSIYFSSKFFGAESCTTSIGYYRLGDVFLAQGDKVSTLAFFDKVVDIWYKLLITSLTAATAEDAAPAAPPSSSSYSTLLDPNSSVTKEVPSAEVLVEGRFHLSQILAVRQASIGDTHIATGEVLYTIGLFEFLYLKNATSALSFIASAREVYKSSLGDSHDSTLQVENVIRLIQERADMEAERSIHYETQFIEEKIAPEQAMMDENLAVSVECL